MAEKFDLLKKVSDNYRKEITIRPRNWKNRVLKRIDEKSVFSEEMAE